MPVGNEVGKFLFAIGEQKEGFSFGKPWRNSDNAMGLVIPIIRDKKVKRNYEMLEETDKLEFVDSGNIDTAIVKNNGKTNIFIRSGVILAGDTQERAVVSGSVAVPNMEQDISVKCVHASKGINPGTKMEYSGKEVPPSVYLALKEEDQSKVWNSVMNYSQSKGINGRRRRNPRMAFSGASSGRIYGARIGSVRTESLSDSDDLLSTMKEVDQKRKTVESALKDIPVVKNQVGAIIFDNFGITGFEVFDSPDSWKALHKKVLEKYSDVLMQEQEESLFELKEDVIPKKIAEFVEEMMKADERNTFSNQTANTYVLDGNKIIGEYTLIEGNVVHVIVFKRKEPKNKDSDSKTRKLSQVRSDLEKEFDNIDRQHRVVGVRNIGRIGPCF